MAMIFDEANAPVTDNEYQVRLLSMVITLVKAAGGRIVIPPPDAAPTGMTFLYTDLMEDGTTVLSVEAKPRPTPELPATPQGEQHV